MSICKIPDRVCYDNYRIHWCIIISNNEVNINIIKMNWFRTFLDWKKAFLLSSCDWRKCELAHVFTSIKQTSKKGGYEQTKFFKM